MNVRDRAEISSLTIDRLVLLTPVVILLALATSCSNNDRPPNHLPNRAAPVVTPTSAYPAFTYDNA
ncbi:MAG: hypothetical protein M3P18_03630, partial [Actinomycetota bacterium]|nr:hypothetical protein [Actinomycetota bacterium]